MNKSSGRKKTIMVLILGAFLFCFTPVLFAQTCTGSGVITKQEIISAQKNWGNGVVHIGKIYSDGGDYKKAAQNFINNFYAYQNGVVMFKPTKVTEKKFRLTKEGALSYFVGGNKSFSEDHGFALHPWVKIRFKNAAYFIHGDYAVVMGEYFFTPKKGDVVAVEYTFGYIKEKNGALKINLHHSSLPYQ